MRKFGPKCTKSGRGRVVYSNAEELSNSEQGCLNLFPKLLSDREHLVAGGSQRGVIAHCAAGGWDMQTEEVQDCQLSTGPLFFCQLLPYFSVNSFIFCNHPIDRVSTTLAMNTC